MAKTREKLVEIDPVWTRIREESVEAVANEPLLGGLVHASLLHHDSLERALAFRMAQKLASGEMSEQLLREIADEAYSTDLRLGQSARADMVAVLERDPACHRFLQPLLFFKGFQAIQAYRVAHWLWRDGRNDLAYFWQPTKRLRLMLKTNFIEYRTQPSFVDLLLRIAPSVGRVPTVFITQQRT